MAEALAVQATALIDLRRQVVNLQAAMRSRELIGQACGVLMSRYRLTEEQAMDALRLVSQHRNVMSGEYHWEIAMAATLVATLPMIVVFAFGQRYFMEGLATTAKQG